MDLDLCRGSAPGSLEIHKGSKDNLFCFSIQKDDLPAPSVRWQVRGGQIQVSVLHNVEELTEKIPIPLEEG
jgi:hypothetical protein